METEDLVIIKNGITMAYTIDLEGKVALITGATKGIGFSAAKILAEAGAQVVIDDILSPFEAHSHISGISGTPHKPYYIQKDISDEKSVKEMVEEVINQFSSIDILINNAGVLADWDLSFAVHNKGLYYCSEEVLKYMVPRGAGKIINISSTCVFSGGTGFPQYVATKGGVYSLTKYYARTYAPKGILVNGIMPSVVFSEMMLQRYESEEQMMDHYVPQMPIRRIGYPEDIAKVVLFLSSNLSDYVCGEVIVADGGKLSVG